MGSRIHALAGVAALALATGLLSFWHLSGAPIFLGRDEVFVGLSGHALSTTGHDLEGAFLPLYVFSRVHGNWWPAMLPYAIAAVLKIVPLSEASVRAPMAFAAIVNVILVFLAGRLLFERRAIAWVPALVLALAPLQIIESRFANDSGLPATFAAAWALAALSYERTGGTWKLAAAGAVLGTGCFCYVGAVPLMPLYAAVTVAALWRRGARPVCYAAFIGGFAVPVLLGGAWLAAHPSVLETTFLHYQNEQFANIDRSAVGALATTKRLADAGRLYFQFWNPSVLFMYGAPWLMHSTRRAGILLFAVAGLLLVGLVRVATRAARGDSQALLLLGGFVLAPVPASLVDINEHTALHATWRAIAILPFAALLTGVGVDYLLSRAVVWARKLGVAATVAIPLSLIVAYGGSLQHRRAMTLLLTGAAIVAVWSVVTQLRQPVLRVVCIALAVVSLLQFWDFYSDYLGDYQQRFVIETDGNVRDALEAVITWSPPVEPGRRAPPVVYLGFRFGAGDWGSYYWQFYLHTRRREDLLARTINDTNASRFDETWICHFPAQSVLATPIRKDLPTDAVIESMIQKGEVALDALVGPVRGRPTFWLLETTGTCRQE